MAASLINTLLEIGEDLVLRRATPADAERLVAFNAAVHGSDPFDAQAVGAWVRDLLVKPHPTFKPEDFTVIEKKDGGEIVSSLNLISQTWAYEGIPFKVGRPELVGTNPDYRGRGLVRTQFDLIHRWSCERGELVQAITGIPNFYRQFGYEMGLELSGGRVGYEPHLPKLKENEEEPYRFRPADQADIPFLQRMAEREARYSMITTIRDEICWQDEISGKSDDNVNRYDIRIIETAAGTSVGYLAHPWFVWGTMQTLSRYLLDEGVSYFSVNPSVIRYLWDVGQKNAAARERRLDHYGFYLGSSHPAYQAAAGLLVKQNDPYAFYVRVPDLPAFLRLIAPVLEKRLRQSVCAGYSGELKISFYRSGVRLSFDQGRLMAAEPWKPRVQVDDGDAFFPDYTFLHLLFGNRTIDELHAVYTDCFAHDWTRVPLEVLFPKSPSSVWPIS